MSIEERLEQLERQNRRLKWGFTAIIAMAVIGGCVGLKNDRDHWVADERARAVATVVQAGRFEVVDSSGLVVAAMGMNVDQTGGVVWTNNRRGTLVAQMGTADDERGVVWTYDREGYLRDSNR